MKKEELDWLKVIIEAVLEFFWSLGAVAIAWNLILPKLFLIPKFGFGKLCLLTLALDLLATPITIGGTMKRDKIYKAIKGEE